jgi:8-oxo-dGTP pyrophosphatase MutT (NUDIX family)
VTRPDDTASASDGTEPRDRSPDALVAAYDAAAVRKRNTVELPADQWSKLDRDDGRWGVGALVVDDGRVLLVREGPKANDWQLPGGMLEAGESHAEGAAREVYEETGLEIEIDGLAAISEQTFVHEEDGDRFEFCFATFDATPVTDGLPSPSEDPGLSGEEIDEVAWHADLPVDVFDRELVERLLSRER